MKRTMKKQFKKDARSGSVEEEDEATQILNKSPEPPSKTRANRALRKASLRANRPRLSSGRGLYRYRYGLWVVGMGEGPVVDLKAHTRPRMDTANSPFADWRLNTQYHPIVFEDPSTW